MCTVQDTCCCPKPGPSRTLQQGAPYLRSTMRNPDHSTFAKVGPIPIRHPCKARSREHISWSVHKMVGCDLTTQKKNTNNLPRYCNYTPAAGKPGWFFRQQERQQVVGFTSSKTDTMTVSPSDPVTPMIVTNSPDTFHHHPMLPVKPSGDFCHVFSSWSFHISHPKWQELILVIPDLSTCTVGQICQTAEVEMLRMSHHITTCLSLRFLKAVFGKTTLSAWCEPNPWQSSGPCCGHTFCAW